MPRRAGIGLSAAGTQHQRRQLLGRQLLGRQLLGRQLLGRQLLGRPGAQRRHLRPWGRDG
jgi:hypothetical protein